MGEFVLGNNVSKPLLGIGFDVDGVLRDTGYPIYEATCKSIRHFGGTPADYSSYVRDFHMDFVGFYRSCGANVSSMEEINSVYWSHITREACMVTPFPDVQECLAFAAHKKLKTFIVSSHPFKEIELWLECFPYGSYDFVIGGSPDKKHCIQKACDELGFSTNHVCYIGDRGDDMRCASHVGAIPVGITRGYDSAAGLRESGAVVVVDHLHDLQLYVR